MHHPIFGHFERFKGFVPPGYQTDFLGVMTRNAFSEGLIAAIGGKSPDPGYVETNYPGSDEEYLEWVDLLESVLDAQQQFTMVELGAGYGRWLVRGATAVRRHRGDLPIRLIGVEAEPTHFEWLKQHFNDNGVDPAQHELIEAAVDEQEHTIRFYMGKPDEWYGQRIAQPQERIEGLPFREVKTITLSRILSGLDLVDLIDLDVEGAELVVLRSAIEELNQKVKRVHVGTHAPDIEQGLRDLFWKHGWYKRNDYAVGRAELTEWGKIYFGNGVQTWINPRLLPVQPTLAELTWLQWAIRSSDFRHGNLQDEVHKLRVELENAPRGVIAMEQVEAQKQEITQLRQQLEGWQKHWQSVENSAGWRLLSAWRRVRDRLAPEGTRRRRLYDSAIGSLRPVPR
jgi:FkbM family methyltransferase